MHKKDVRIVRNPLVPYLTDGRILEGKRAVLLREGRAVDGEGAIAGEIELNIVIV